MYLRVVAKGKTGMMGAVRFWMLVSTSTLLLAGCEPAKDVSPDMTVQDFDPNVLAAVQDLESRLNVGPNEITLVDDKSVTWRNSSLGCPKEGMMYTQALVEGSLIVLQVDGKNYQYHSGKGRAPFLCENPEKPTAMQNTKAKSFQE